MSSTANTTHRRSWRTCWACAVLTALCAPRAIAQDAARQPQVQTAPRPSRSIESWAASTLPSHEQLKKIEIDAELLLCIDRLGDSTYATREEAMDNIREAIQGYVVALEEDGLPVPEEKFDTLLVAV